MKQAKYCVFDTAIGPCGIAWTLPAKGENAPAIAVFRLPEATLGLTESRIARRAGASGASTPPAAVAEVIGRIQRHLSGDLQDFRDVAVDLEGEDPFAQRVYEAARAVPAGRTTTYGEIAKHLGWPDAAQEVGAALGKNPVTLIIPCHRVLAAGGRLGGFSAHGSTATKTKLLAIEGAFTLPLLPAKTTALEV
jgi:O-6-methylguanine DNA methyltransferase